MWKNYTKNVKKFKQAHKIDDFVTRTSNVTNSPTLGKISTKIEYEYVELYFFFGKNAPLKCKKGKNSKFGHTS